MNGRTRLLVTVKTYPIISSKYIELVCTAGLTEHGSWVRIYPAPFRFISTQNQYKKYQWISLHLDKNPKDRRPESYRPKNIDDIELAEVVSTQSDWFERRKLVLGKGQTYKSLRILIDLAKRNELSLATFKPAKVVDVVAERHPSFEHIEKMKLVDALRRQGSLFNELSPSNAPLMPNIPFKFKMKFIDCEGVSSKLMIEDWEVGQLYLNLRKTMSEEDAADGVRDKLMKLATDNDLYLFLGTTLEWHSRSPNPFIIVGLFYPPLRVQMELF